MICPIFHFWLQLNPLLSGLIESCGPADVWAPTPHSPPSPLAGTPAGPWALQPPPAASKTPAAPTATAHRVIHALRLLISIYFCISAPFIISEGLVEVEQQDVLKGKYCPRGSAPVLPLNLMLLTDLVIHFPLLNCDHTCERMIWFTLVERQFETTKPSKRMSGERLNPRVLFAKYKYTSTNAQIHIHKLQIQSR